MKDIKNKGEHQIMGLFDNLFKKLKSSSTDRNSQVQGKPKISFEPFKSEAEKQYYEMAYGLLASSTKERSGDDIRRFVGFHTSRETDFSVSSAARSFLKEGSILSISLFKNNNELTTALTAKGISSDKIEQIIELNKKLDESFAYRYLPEDADTICNPNNYDYDFYKKTLVFKNSRDSIVPLTAERAAALKAAEKAAAEKAAAEKAAAEKAAATLTNDEVAKRYYTIVCGLLDSIDRATCDDVKQYIECHIKQSCDAEKINFILKFLNQNGKYYFINEKYYKLIGVSIEDINQYKLSKEEAYRIRYSGLFENIKAECKEIFSIATSYGVEHFDKGWVRRDWENKYANTIGVEVRNYLYRQAVQELFFEGEASVVEILCNRFDCYSATARNYYWARYGGVHSVQKAMPIVAKHAGAVAVRTLHFEKYGQDRKGYKPLTEDECRDMISNSEPFKRAVGQIMGIDPFGYKEWANGEVESKFAIFDWIQKEVKAQSYYSSGCEYLPSDAEYYYADALCNAFWKYVEKRYQNVNSMDFDTIFEIMLDYFTPGEKVIDELVNRDNRREALLKQCQSCALYDSCHSRRENCPSWIPKQR